MQALCQWEVQRDESHEALLEFVQRDVTALEAVGQVAYVFADDELVLFCKAKGVFQVGTCGEDIIRAGLL